MPWARSGTTSTWRVVVDTGSTDGTQEMVRELLAGVPGFLLERPWRDFGHNRTEALEAAEHAEYSFVINADEVFAVEPKIPLAGN